MLDFQYDETQEMVRDTVRSFARDHLRPQNRTAETAGAVPPDLERRYQELGLTMLHYPEATGGGGLGLETAVLVAEELGWGDPGIAAALPGPGPAGRMIAELGSDGQQQDFLAPMAAGPKRTALLFHPWQDESDPDGLPLTYIEAGNGYYLSGALPVVPGAPAADLFVAVARHEGGAHPRAFVLDPGDVQVGDRLETCGLEALAFAPVSVDGHVAPGEVLDGDAVAAVTKSLAEARLLAAATIVGAARAGNEEAVAYAQERRAFGKQIGQFQGLAFMLADAATAVTAARNLVTRAAWAMDAGRPDAAAACAEAAVHAFLAGDKVATDSVQVYGGNGFVMDYPLEKWMRDIRTLSCLWGARPQLDAAAVPADPADWLETA